MIERIKAKIYRIFHRPLGEVWVLHRVLEEPDESIFPENRNLSITGKELERRINLYRSNGYKFVSLDEACEIQEKGQGPKYVCITFDDGYRDNLTVAYPILKRLEAPFTIFIVTDYLERKAHLWWYWIEELRKKDASVSFGKLHDEFITVNPNGLDSYMNTKYPEYNEWNAAMLEKIALSSSEVKELSADPLCTIGVHTISHCRLDLLDEATQRTQITLAKEKLEQLTGKTVVHLSYPYGGHNAVTEKICRELGFKSAFKAWGGAMRKSESMISGNREKILMP